jgi:hypothetical protein
MEAVTPEELIACLRKIATPNLRNIDLKERDLNGLNFSGLFLNGAIWWIRSDASF